ncbi:MBL fold metallo-hydrolase [Nanoarchaeota archaeon]
MPEEKETGRSIDDVFRVHVLGVGSCLSPFHSSVSFIVQTGERMILLEAPAEPVKRLHDYRAALRDRYACAGYPGLDIERLKLDNITDVIISHSHKDHCAGLEPMAFYKMFGQDFSLKHGAPKIRLYGIEGVLAELKLDVQRNLENSGFPLDSYLDLVQVEEGDPVSIGDAELVVLKNHHGMKGFATMIRYNGKGFAYSGDTCFNSRLLDRLSLADVIAHDCDGTDVIHTAAAELAEWKERSGYTGRLYACHFPDEVVPIQVGLTPMKENYFIDI